MGRPDYRRALGVRLGAEWGDAALAAEVVAGLDAGIVAALEDRVPLDAVATSPLLGYRPTPRPAATFAAAVAYAFGYREGPDGTLEPGPVNAALAAATCALLAVRAVPVLAQVEIAQLLRADGVPDVAPIEPVTNSDGTTVYLSTAGVAAQATVLAPVAGIQPGPVAVVAFADHLGRAVLTTRAAGLDAAPAAGMALPSDYDPQSAQPWTRNRRAYLATDLAGRVATL